MRHPERDLPYSGMLCSGMIAGAITSLFLTPIELVKCKMQVPLETPGSIGAAPTIRGVIASIYRHQGLLARPIWNLDPRNRRRSSLVWRLRGHEDIVQEIQRIRQRRGPSRMAAHGFWFCCWRRIQLHVLSCRHNQVEDADRGRQAAHWRKVDLYCRGQSGLEAIRHQGHVPWMRNHRCKVDSELCIHLYGIRGAQEALAQSGV